MLLGDIGLRKVPSSSVLGWLFLSDGEGAGMLNCLLRFQVNIISVIIEDAEIKDERKAKLSKMANYTIRYYFFLCSPTYSSRYEICAIRAQLC